MRDIFVTAALPYANGDLHLGHILEYVQADIWVRSQRMLSHRVYFVCADDAHGVPIMIAAEAAQQSPREFVRAIASKRKEYLDGFELAFDHWHSTDSVENEKLTVEIYQKLKATGLIVEREVEQYFDQVKNMFLPDRYVKGECPKCHALDQYSDNCEVCASVYAPTDLLNPYSVLTGSNPIRKSSRHLFFKLSDKRCWKFINDWTKSVSAQGVPAVQVEVRNKLDEWLQPDADGNSKLEDWDISRDAPYFGIPIPDTVGKYFYVWLDAPICYLASLQYYLENKLSSDQRSFEDYMNDPNVEQYHFIGKDIITFHTLFWPAILHFSGRKTPTSVFVHGFLTVNGEKMSKSKGTGWQPLRYLHEGLNPNALRYYLASKLTAKHDDIDIDLKDFVNKVNADIVGKWLNIAARSAVFLQNHFANQLGEISFPESTSPHLHGGLLLEEAQKKLLPEVITLYTRRNFAQVIRNILGFVDQINVLIDHYKPWFLVKHLELESERKLLHSVCSTSIQAFRLVSIMMKPITPSLTDAIEEFLGSACKYFDDGRSLLPVGHVIGHYTHLMKRMELAKVQSAFLNSDYPKNLASPPSVPSTQDTSSMGQKLPDHPVNLLTTPQIDLPLFTQIDMRVGLIVECHAVEGSNKLLRLMIDLGEGRLRQIFSGIAKFYRPEDLIGNYTIVLVNLVPRKMRFGISEGMVLAASSDNEAEGIYILQPQLGAKVGMRIS
ncbi:MAG: methionine--tRNA ligase [Gammaproteobacteria bacterium]|nr:methionine--tRNA ligase [Gammaproteobacteria bacterium]